MTTARRTAAICLLALAILLLPSTARAGGFAERLFTECAEWRGEDYALGRRALVARGREALPLVKEKTESPDWRERALAGCLKLRIESPEKVEAWRKAVLDAASDCAALRDARLYGKEPVWAEIKEESAGAPAAVLIDLLREPQHSDGRNIIAVGFQFYLAPDADLARAFLEEGLWDWRTLPLLRRGLVRLGAVGLPALRGALRPTCTPPAAELEKKDPAGFAELAGRFWADCRRVMPAIRAAGELGDAECVPVLLERLGQEAGSRPSDYTEALAGALSRLGAEQAIAPILERLLATASGDRFADEGCYRALRGHFVTYGRRALPALTARLPTAKKDREKVILEHLLAELSGAKGQALRLAELREELGFRETAAGLLELHALTGEDVLPRLQKLHSDQTGPALLALGTLRDARAVPGLLGRVIATHESLAARMQKRPAGSGSAALDFQDVRELNDTSWLCGMDGLAKTVSWGDLNLLVIWRIGGAEARRALVRAAEFPEYAAPTRAFLLDLDGKADELVKALGAGDRAVREAAALVLHEREDGRAARELLAAAARRRGEGHREWRARALASRKDLGPVLHEMLKSKDLRERVLAEALSIAAADPQKAKGYEAAVLAAANSVSRMHCLNVGMIEGAGRALAAKQAPPAEAKPVPEKKAEATESIDVPLGDRSWPVLGEERAGLDESHIPLLEATCLFGQGLILRGVAAFALAEFRKPRSMPVLAASFDMGSLGGSNPAALALADFGKEGAELAAKLPAPRPAEPDTGLQMTQHRGGVQVLAEHKDIRGVEEVLKGLATLAKDRKLDGWEYRARIYLSAAGKYHDARLVEPLMRILETAERPEKDCHAEVIALLSAYDDPRIPPMLLARLATLFPRGLPDEFNSSDSLHCQAVEGLTRCLGERVADRLVGEYGQSKDERLRAGMLMALAELSYPSSPAYPGKAEWSRERFKEDKDRAAAAGRTRKLAYPILVEALKDPADAVNRIAAVGLTVFAQGNRPYGSVSADKRPVGPLTDWCRRRRTCFYPLTEYLGDHGDAETGKVLLGLLDADPPCRADVHIAEAVVKLQPEGAVPILERRARRLYREYREKRWFSFGTGLDDLAGFGKPGAQALLCIFRDMDYLPYRVHAAMGMARVGYGPAREPVEKLLAETIRLGPRNPKLVCGERETADAVYVRTCKSLLESLDGIDRQRAIQVAERIFLDGPGPLRPAALRLICRDDPEKPVAAPAENWLP